MRSSLRALSSLAALALAFTLLPLAAAAAPDDGDGDGAEEAFSLDLAGDWRFALGDDLAWADPDFDDSGWETREVPREGGQADFDSYDGFAWFRLTFELPADARGANLIAALGRIDDADATYLNGVEIGSTGSFSPDRDSQWFAERLYPVPADLPRYGGENVLAIRMEDQAGGGGIYSGPIGLFSKAALRVAQYGIDAPPAPADLAAAVTERLAAQAAALRDGDLDAYLALLDDGFFHDGQDRDRRRRFLADLLTRFDALALSDSEVEVLRDADGTLVVDTNRALVGLADGEETVIRPREQAFLAFSADGTRELGNRSRFFRDAVDSALEGAPRSFNVYLPPSYLTEPDRRFPTVYLLHGINGGNREWEPRRIDERLDAMLVEHGIAESIVVMPDGESLWYVDSSDAPWRSMFTSELLPLVDAEYRTIDDRAMRGVSGVSMGGHGAFTVGWAHPELFGSIASHMGALSLPPLAGTPAEVAANAPEAPVTQASARTPEFLSSYRYFFDACRDDEFRFGEAVEAMRGQLTAKLVAHTAEVYPEGRHNDECWVPKLWRSFGMHSDAFRERGLVETRRLAGPGRVETAVEVARRRTRGGSAETVVLARADDFADALAGGPLAHGLDAPLLLTGRDGLAPAVRAEIARLGATSAVLLGGEAALSPAVAAALADAGVTDVRRIAGPNRFATAAAVAAEVGGDAVYVARGAGPDGTGWADALAVGAAAAHAGRPILLTPAEALAPETAAALGSLEPAEAVLVGGTAAVSQAVADAVAAAGPEVTRIGGANRFATSALLADHALGLGLTASSVWVATGGNWPDALAAGAAAARDGSVLLLVDGADLDRSPATRDWFAGRDEARFAWILGGRAAIGDGVERQLRTVLGAAAG
jgi:putative cell wall-binding protein